MLGARATSNKQVGLRIISGGRGAYSTQPAASWPRLCRNERGRATGRNARIRQIG